MRVAVFVDAGYVYPQGSSSLSGKEKAKTRNKLTLDENVFAELLKQQAHTSSNGKELLRIYWYDAVSSSGPSPDQARIGKLNDVKLRLGQLNSEGQQKGVDSLIVTDLIELARNKAICDAVVLTGDEDIRIGVQIAQSLGVRVHLLGFVGPRGNQSISLQQESDTLEIWDKSKVASFLRDSAAKPEKIQRQAKADAKPRSAAAKTASVTPAKEAPAATRADGPEILIAVQKAFELLSAHPEKFDEARSAVAGKLRLPSQLTTSLNVQLKSRLKRNPTRPEFAGAKEALSKKLMDAG